VIRPKQARLVQKALALIRVNIILFISYLEETFLKDIEGYSLFAHLSLTETWVSVDV